MSDVTRILSQTEHGDTNAAEKLLPLVYEELRKLAAAKLAQEKPGQTLNATALVHEAYVRLVDGEQASVWNSRGHFFAAAAEAMRRILTEDARRKQSHKRGGNWTRLNLDEIELVGNLPPDEMLYLNDAINALAANDPAAAELVKIRYFTGLTIEDAAQMLGTSCT